MLNVSGLPYIYLSTEPKDSGSKKSKDTISSSGDSVRRARNQRLQPLIRHNRILTYLLFPYIFTVRAKCYLTITRCARNKWPCIMKVTSQKLNSSSISFAMSNTSIFSPSPDTNQILYMQHGYC